ncbi:MAG: arylsulfotransferase family protein [Nocardiopsaceae bacterium]|nr:arylsulfotransferase family protein [Nocardiopsaceae bacterium]
MGDSRFNRRNFLIGGGTVAGLAGLGGAGAIGYAWPHSPGSADDATTDAAGSSFSTPDWGAHSYVSRGDLFPPRVSVTISGSTEGVPPYLFLANKPYKGPVSVGQKGLLITQQDGEPVWFSPISGKGQVLDLNVSSYKGKPVLTWWHGITGAIYAKGNCYIADSSYSPVATVKAGNGLMADMHEFNLTDQGTALLDAYRPHTVDLSPVGGPSKGTLVSGVAQEIDIATGEVIFEWDSIDHVPITETKEPFFGGTTDNPYDYFHINSIAVATDGNLLISSRHTWTVYKVHRHTGKVLWRLGGKKSDFSFGPGAGFSWQHHVREPASNLVTVFDNASSPPEASQSRGLILNLDTQRMHATLQQAFTYPAAGLLSDNQGSMQLLPGNRALVGWGSQPFFNAYEADGSVTLSGNLQITNQSYRAFAGQWTGHPKDKPALVVKPNPARGVAAYASWNGATEVETWRVHAGKSESSMDVVAQLPSTGFETVIPANSAGPYYMVTAHDSSGSQLGQSEVVHSG